MFVFLTLKIISKIFFLLQDSVSTASDEPFRIVRGRKIKGYTDEDLNEALNQIRNGMPLGRMAREYKIPQRTLRSIIDRTTGKNSDSNSYPKIRIRIIKTSGYTLEEREKALDEIREGMPVGRAARLFNIPQRTLRTCIEREKIRAEKEKNDEAIAKSGNERSMLLYRIKEYNEKLGNVDL